MKTKTKITAFIILLALLFGICTAVPYGSFSPSLQASAQERVTLIPGGRPFGIKFFTKGVIVIGVTDIQTYGGLKSPAGDAGVKAGDIITSVDGKAVTTTDELSQYIGDSKGKPTLLTITREGSEITISVTPQKSAADGIYKSGLWVRDSTAGIGTVTYVNGKTGEFGGLGHGICDPETGLPLPLLKGIVTNVMITGVIKGNENEPGELRGEFSAFKSGKIDINSECGVFGTLNNVRDFTAEPIEICFASELKTGKAYILTTVEGNTPSMYEIEIVKIYPNSGKTKNFLIRVTDKALIEKTGGIVQGMSGSPIIQDGRLCGAVTHVLINNPRKGYGIFVENMLEASVKAE